MNSYPAAIAERKSIFNNMINTGCIMLPTHDNAAKTAVGNVLTVTADWPDFKGPFEVTATAVQQKLLIGFIFEVKFESADGRGAICPLKVLLFCQTLTAEGSWDIATTAHIHNALDCPKCEVTGQYLVHVVEGGQHATGLRTMAASQKIDHRRLSLTDNTLPYQLHVTLLRGEDLVAMDSGRIPTSDPYVKFVLGNQQHKSHVVPKSLNPTWNQTFVFHVANIKTDELQLNCWDQDFCSRDEPMGSALIRKLQHLKVGIAESVEVTLENVAHGKLFLELKVIDFDESAEAHQLQRKKSEMQRRSIFTREKSSSQSNKSSKK